MSALTVKIAFLGSTAALLFPTSGFSQKVVQNPTQVQQGPEQTAPVQQNPVQQNPGQVTPEQQNPAQQNPGQVTPPQQNPAQQNPGQVTPVQQNPEQQNPGQVTPVQQDTPAQIAGQTQPCGSTNYAASNWDNGIPYILVVKMPIAQAGQVADGSRIIPLSIPLPVNSQYVLDGDALLRSVVSLESTAPSFELTACGEISNQAPDVIQSLLQGGGQNYNTTTLAWRDWISFRSGAGIYGFGSRPGFGAYMLGQSVYAPSYGYYQNGIAYQYGYKFYRQSGSSYYFFYYN